MRRTLVIALALPLALAACQTSPAPEPPRTLDTVETTLAAPDSDHAVRLALFWDAADHAARIKLGQRLVRTDAELAALLNHAHKDLDRLRRPDTPIVIDAAPDVPYLAVLHLLVACKTAGFTTITFALPSDSSK